MMNRAVNLAMRKTRLFAILLPGLAILALAMPGPKLSADEDDVNPPAMRQPAQSPLTGTALATGPANVSVGLSLARQQHSGLKTQALSAFSMHTDSIAYGRVMDIRPLLEVRSRYRSAQSELAIIEAALRVAQKNHERLESLHQASIIATRDLILAESQLAAEQTRREAAARHIREVREEAMQGFGATLFRLAVETESSLLQGLLGHSLVLLLVALPANQSLPDQTRTIAIMPSGEMAKSRPANLVSPAPKTEESTQGETWFFATAAAGLRTGMRLDAHIPLPGQAAKGVLLPLSAVVWHEGQPWVYLKTEAESFVRRPVGPHRDRGEDWFVAEGFAPGQEVVVVGGQMLLSEEQRRNALTGGDGD